MMGPLPPSLVCWLTKSTLVLWPAAAARRVANWAMVGRRTYLSALSRLSTTWRISSTKPSNPMKAVIWATRSVAVESRWAQPSRSSGVFTRNTPSLCHSEDLEDALKLIIAEKDNFQGAFAVGVAQMNFGAQALAQAVLDLRHVGVARERVRSSRLGAGAGFAGLQPRDEALGLADVEGFFEDALGGQLLQLLARQPENNFCVAD